MLSKKIFQTLIVWTCILVINFRFTDGIFGGEFWKKKHPELEEPLSTVPPIPATSEAVIEQRLGVNVKKKKYDNQYYVGQSGGPIDNGDDLECNFQGFCCWDNVGYPTDQFDWGWATGDADQQKLQDNFGTSTKPNGRYLIAARQKSSATNEAMFISCTVTCTTRPIKVKFRHWTTQGVQLQVCSSETFFNENNKVQLINCKDVRRSSSPGPDTISIPPGEFLDIIFVASNFQDVQGGIAIIDDIVVDVTPCPNKKESTKPTTRRK